MWGGERVASVFMANMANSPGKRSFPFEGGQSRSAAAAEVGGVGGSNELGPLLAQCRGCWAHCTGSGSGREPEAGVLFATLHCSPSQEVQFGFPLVGKSGRGLDHKSLKIGKPKCYFGGQWRPSSCLQVR